jgi:ribosome maturation factor RimP
LVSFIIVLIWKWGNDPASFFRKEEKMQKHSLQDMLEPVIEALGYETIRILTIGQVNPTLQVMIDVKDYSREINVEDCAKVSRALSATLDEKDPIKDKYSLEVSSPGLDRPLTKPEHFVRFKDYVIKVETINEVEKRKRIKGINLGLNENNEVRVDMDGKEYVIAFDNISKAKIVITDELWEKYQAEHEAIEL